MTLRMSAIHELTLDWTSFRKVSLVKYSVKPSSSSEILDVLDKSMDWRTGCVCRNTWGMEWSVD